MNDEQLDRHPGSSAYLVLFGSQLAIGSAAIFARFALLGAGPIVVSALRLTIAAVPLFCYTLIKHRKLKIPGKHESLFCLSGIALGAHFASWFASLLYTPVGLSTLLVCTAPVWTALYDTLILKVRLGRNFWPLWWQRQSE